LLFASEEPTSEDRKEKYLSVQSGKTVSPLPDSRAAAVREQLDRLLSDSAFSGANRRSRLLRYLVEQSLDDRPETLKESVIATEVFDRTPDYDPQIDSVVRVEVGRLRARLAEYYDKAGSGEPVRIEIPRGGYRPLFVFRESAAEPGVPVTDVEPDPQPSHPNPAQGARSRNWKTAAAATIAVLAILTAFAVWRLRISSRPTPATPASIAVLPFLNLGADASDEYLGDGISEELTETLAEFSELRVVARTSAFQYKRKNADVRDIGINLKAGALIEGSVARRGGQFHVIAQLIRSSDGYHLWSHTYDAALAELPTVEADIARATREKLTPAAAVVRDVSTTVSPEAHDLYMRAAYEMNLRTEASTRQAIALANQATEKDSSFAQPYVLMAAGESQLNTLLAQAPHAGAERAWAEIEKALALDPGNSGAHAQKALLAYTDQWDWPQAEREFRLALAAGSHGSAENLYGWSLMTRGRFAESQRHLQIAAELDPLSLGPQLNQVTELLDERNYPEAKRKVGQILQTAPANAVALYLASSVAFWQRDCPAATEWNHKLIGAYPNSFIARSSTATANAVCDPSADAKAAVADLLRPPASAFVSPYSVAAAYALGNDVDHAMLYLQKSAELREPVIVSLKVDRAFESIRQDPRFIALERRIGLLD
jgi:TolB-like protein/Tfp pilus assembly protein PilF